MKRSICFILLAVFFACFHLSCEEKLGPELPTLSKVSVTGVTINAASLSSAISKSGNQEILDHGFVVSLTDTPPIIDNSALKKGTIDRTTPTPIAINASLKDLKTATTYYVHAFALLASGAVFSEVVTFQTSNVTQPVAKTEGADSITYNTARLMASIISKGSYPITEYGIVWSGTANPTAESASKYTIKSDVNQVPATFTTFAGGLSPNTKYYFRAYVISNGITSYGADLNFSTTGEIQPFIQTGESKVGSRVATLFGQITGKGSSPISQYGICWSTGSNPTTGSDKFVITKDVNFIPTTFSGEAYNLTPTTTYHYRAFVTMNGVTSYGQDRTFFTTNERQPTVVTGTAKASDWNAYLTGHITTKGDADISQYGICWSKLPNPSLASNKQVINGNITTFPRSFLVYAADLQNNTTYHYRAFVTMNGKTTYGADKTFLTLLPVN